MGKYVDIILDSMKTKT